MSSGVKSPNPRDEPAPVMLKLSQREKGILLRLFNDHKVAKVSAEDWKSICSTILEELRSNSAVRASVRKKIKEMHIDLYRKNYVLAVINDGGPYFPDIHGNVMIGADGKPWLEVESLKQLEENGPDAKFHRENLAELNNVTRAEVKSSENVADNNPSQTALQHQFYSDELSKKRKGYDDLVQRVLKKRRLEEKQSKAVDRYKLGAVHSSLEIQQQNAVSFHALATAYCKRNNQPPPGKLKLPILPMVPAIAELLSDSDFDDTEN